MILEICIDGTDSARAAREGGADRVELCANLPEGGTTPSAGMIRAVRAIFPRALMVIIRPRGYDFLYSDEEMDVMLQDIRVARDLGADGVVIGCLDAEARIDVDRCRRLMEAAAGMDITFHRAFDMTRDPCEALETLAAIGIRRVLSSGARSDASAGAHILAGLVRQAAGRVSIMPGGGLNERNLAAVMRKTGATEAHLSAREPFAGGMRHFNRGCHMGEFSKNDEYAWRVTSTARVAAARARLDELAAELPPHAC